MNSRGENSPQGVLNKTHRGCRLRMAHTANPPSATAATSSACPSKISRRSTRSFINGQRGADRGGQVRRSQGAHADHEVFWFIPRHAQLDKTWTEEPAQDGERLVTLRRVGDVSAVGVAYISPLDRTRRNASLQVLANILSTRPSGRLTRRSSRRRKRPAPSAFAGHEHDPGLFSLDAEVPRDIPIEEVRDTLIETRNRREGCDRGRVNRARQQILKARDRPQRTPRNRSRPRSGPRKAIGGFIHAPRPDRAGHTGKSPGAPKSTCNATIAPWLVHTDGKSRTCGCAADARRGGDGGDYKGPRRAGGGRGVRSHARQD